MALEMEVTTLSGGRLLCPRCGRLSKTGRRPQNPAPCGCTWAIILDRLVAVEPLAKGMVKLEKGA